MTSEAVILGARISYMRCKNRADVNAYDLCDDVYPSSPGILPTAFREITGNTLSSNKYRVMVCEDRMATRFDGFRIYSKDESPPDIPLSDVIESLIELNTFH